MNGASPGRPDPFSGGLELNLGGYILDTPGKSEPPRGDVQASPDWAGAERYEEAFEYEEPKAPPRAAASPEMVERGGSSAGMKVSPRPLPPDGSRSLGVWRLDKKRRKRVYVSLTGERLEGRRGLCQQRQDQLAEAYSNWSVRSELVQMLVSGPRSMSDLAEGAVEVPLSAFGVPSVVCARYEQQHVTSLFGWQTECLLIGGGRVLRGERNLVYSAPTSGGKTLVAEVLMLYRLAALQKSHLGAPSPSGPRQRGLGTILFVVPFVALAEEKASYFQRMWRDMHIGVQAYHGDDEGRVLTADVEVAVCTIEKANIILNQLLDGDGAHDGVSMEQLSMIVVDELHLVSDSKRGFLLEVLLSKARFVWGSHVQIVGLSATLPNLGDISRWIDGEMYCTEYRPVELKTHICLGRQFYDPSTDLPDTGAWQGRIPAVSSVRPLQSWLSPLPVVIEGTAYHSKLHEAVAFLSSADADGLISLCVETVLRDSKSVIVFCPTKKWCDRAATIIAQALSILRNIEGEWAQAAVQSRGTDKDMFLSILAAETRRRENCKPLLFSLRQCPVAVCPVLEQSLHQGVAYHHAGLTMDERRVVERGFREGAINVLCATSTLAAGVNLPAHRVIIRSPKMGPSELSVASFRQMSGRAGRMNLDSEGEAILMVQDTSRERALAVRLTAAGELPALRSAIKDGSGGGIARLLLEMVYCGRVDCESDVDRYLNHTLWSAQEDGGAGNEKIQTAKREAMSLLLKHEFVILVEGPAMQGRCHTAANIEFSGQKRQRNSPGETRRLIATPLGRATALSGLPPRDAVEVLASLQDARRSLVLRSGLHPIYLATPPHPSVQPAWATFEHLLAILQKDYPDTSPALTALGVDYGELQRLTQAPPRPGVEDARVLFYRRLYSAILLFVLVQEVPLTKVADYAALNRGQLQQLQKEASSFCGMATSFCRKLNWEPLGSVLQAYAGRLSYGVAEELLPLVRLGPQVMPAFRARHLFRHNIKSAEDIVSIGCDAVTKLLVSALPFDSNAPLHAATTVPGSERGDSKDNSEYRVGMCRRLAVRIVDSATRAIADSIT